jgi:pimeloyl-ACP methyl ester carboxylesterase
MQPKAPLPSIVLVPGGGSSVRGYFPELESRLQGRVRLLEVDPPGLDVPAGRRWLRNADHARVLAEAVRQEGVAPVVVVGHSLGGLVALRLALDEPGLVAGLLLLDPSPLMPATLLPAGLLRPIGRLRGMLRRMRPFASNRRAARRPRSARLAERLLWYLVLDGGALAADICATGLRGLPTVVISAAEHGPDGVTRRTHERIVSWVPGARLEIWPDTTHGLQVERPAAVAEAILSLLEQVQAEPSAA